MDEVHVGGKKSLAVGAIWRRKARQDRSTHLGGDAYKDKVIHDVMSAHAEACILECITIGRIRAPQTTQIYNTKEESVEYKCIMDVVVPFVSGSLRESGGNRRGFGLGVGEF